MAEKNQIHENRPPLENSLDVLLQYLITLSVGAGFDEKEAWKEIKSTFSFRNLSVTEWRWAIEFITSGGKSLSNY